MAADQLKHDRLCKLGQGKAQDRVGGQPTSKKAPFDLVDFQSGIAWEVKTRSAAVVSVYPIGIEKAAMQRKRAFLRRYHLKGRLLVVVIGSTESDISLYAGPLKAHTRISALRKVK